MTGARAIIAIEKNRLTFSTVVCLLSPAADMAPHQVCAAVGQLGPICCTAAST
jgi:hypothetical protein